MLIILKSLKNISDLFHKRNIRLRGVFMRIVIPKEVFPGEKRVAMVPSIVQKLKQLNVEVAIESSLGDTISASDEDYRNAGAEVSNDRQALLKSADMVLRVRHLSKEETSLLKKGCIHLSFLDPFNEYMIIDEMMKQGISAFSLEMLPRTTLLQKMDALSSQANLAGYVAVIMAAERLKKILPMMTTPAGTIPPARVFVIGVGVAGLQAIATARRLGARVEAFDTRPVVEEQVKSLGARFVQIDLGDTGQTKDGYATALTEEQQAKQKEEMKKICSKSDIVITTAQVMGRKAPRILDKDIVEGMQPGSVVVDMAVESGGNVEGSKLNETVMINGVSVIGIGNLPGRVSEHASQLYATNLYHFINHFSDSSKEMFELNLNNELLKNCLITHDFAIQNDAVKQSINKGDK